MIKRALIPAAAGFRQQHAGGGPAYDPATAWEYYFPYSAAKTGWNTELGGDGTTTMFIDAPQLAIAEGGTFPGIETGDTAGHAINPPYGWSVNDTIGTLTILAGGGEIAIKPSRWYGTSDTDLAPGTGPFFWGFFIKNWQGSAGDDLIKGSGATLPSAKLENVGGFRLKINDNFNTLSDGTGTDATQCEFQLSPQPVNGDSLFIGFSRDIANQRYNFWHGQVEAGATRANLQVTHSITTNSIYLKTTTTAQRADNLAQRLVRFNEGTGIAEFIYQKTISSYAELHSRIGDHFEYLVSLLP